MTFQDAALPVLLHCIGTRRFGHILTVLSGCAI
jgi:hypothetical protein